MTRNSRSLFLMLLGLFTTGAYAQSARACSVCFGDADSLMVKGAIMGVYVLVGIVGVVMLGMVATVVVWHYRGRRLSLTQDSSSPLDS
jgi:hypothetical protein